MRHIGWLILATGVVVAEAIMALIWFALLVGVPILIALATAEMVEGWTRP